jgi:hypothetical protein
MNRLQDKIPEFSPYVTPCKISLAQRHCLTQYQQNTNASATNPTCSLNADISRLVVESSATPRMMNAAAHFHPKALKGAALLPDVLLDEDSLPSDSAQEKKVSIFLASNASSKEVGEGGPARVVTEADFFLLKQTVSDLQSQLLFVLNEREVGSETLFKKSSSLLTGSHQIEIAELPPAQISGIVEVFSHP